MLTLASNWPKVTTPLPSGAQVLQTNMDFATVRQNVSVDADFIRAGLVLRRAAKPTPQPLAAVPAGASDIQLRRVLIWGGTEDGIRVIGTAAGAVAAPVIVRQPQAVTVAAGQSAGFSIEVSGNPAPAVR